MTPDTQILIPTYTVFSRHSPECPHTKRNHLQCNCKKHVAVYDPRQPKIGTQDVEYGNQKITIINRQGSFPAKTRSYRDAELIAQAYRDLHDPVKRELAEERAKRKAAEAEKESQTATIQKAVALFY